MDSNIAIRRLGRVDVLNKRFRMIVKSSSIPTKIEVGLRAVELVLRLGQGSCLLRTTEPFQGQDRDRRDLLKKEIEIFVLSSSDPLGSSSYIGVI